MIINVLLIIKAFSQSIPDGSITVQAAAANESSPDRFTPTAKAFIVVAIALGFLASIALIVVLKSFIVKLYRKFNQPIHHEGAGRMFENDVHAKGALADVKPTPIWKTLYRVPKPAERIQSERHSVPYIVENYHRNSTNTAVQNSQESLNYQLEERGSHGNRYQNDYDRNSTHSLQSRDHPLPARPTQDPSLTYPVNM